MKRAMLKILIHKGIIIGDFYLTNKKQLYINR